LVRAACRRTSTGIVTACAAYPSIRSHGLRRVSVDTIQGLIFICFTDDPLSLEAARRDLEEPMAMFDFPNLKVAAHKVYDIPANWKLSIENYQECYHCATAHPEYARSHTLMVDNKRRGRLQKDMLEKMAACGLREYDIFYMDIHARPGGHLRHCSAS
jgi:Rieske 2Fe-2S family protein